MSEPTRVIHVPVETPWFRVDAEIYGQDRPIFLGTHKIGTSDRKGLRFDLVMSGATLLVASDRLVEGQTHGGLAVVNLLPLMTKAADKVVAAIKAQEAER